MNYIHNFYSMYEVMFGAGVLAKLGLFMSVIIHFIFPSLQQIGDNFCISPVRRTC